MRSRRVNWRVVREYIGMGPIAEGIAALDARQSAERLAEKEAWNRKKERMEEVEDCIKCFCEDARSLTHSVLISAGHHRHHWGKWRKRRVKKGTSHG